MLVYGLIIQIHDEMVWKSEKDFGKWFITIILFFILLSYTRQKVVNIIYTHKRIFRNILIYIHYLHYILTKSGTWELQNAIFYLNFFHQTLGLTYCREEKNPQSPLTLLLFLPYISGVSIALILKEIRATGEGKHSDSSSEVACWHHDFFEFLKIILWPG